nr:phage baseplate hub and tail lysozyme [uncultured Mediterranean phage uvMED]
MSSNHFMGTDGFVWFVGVVEDRNDPSELGRVRVRCVGFHTEDKTRIPTEGLPWAHVMHPVTDPSMSGMGHTPSFLVEGSWVVGFFRDAEEKQQPIVMGTLPGIPEDLGNPNTGFNDPNRRDDDSSKPGYNISIYPREEDVADVNRLARTIGQEEQNKTILRSKRARVVNGVRSASGETWDEPPTTYNAKYPKNHVFESESGHIVEYDDTSGASRVHHYHKAGTFHEIDSVGNKVDKVEGINYEIKKANSWEFVEGDMNLTVHGTLNIKAKNFNLEVDESYEQEVGKDRTTRIGGIDSFDINGEVLETFNNKVTRSFHGAVDERYGDKIDRYHSGIVTNNHQANLLHFIKGGDAEFHIIQSGETGGTFDIFSEISVNIDTKTIDFDAETVASITSATTTINGSTSANLRGATVDIDGTTVDIDATTYNLNATSSNLVTVTVGAASPHLADPSVTSPSSASVTEPTEPEEEDPIEVVLPQIEHSDPKSSTVGGDEDGVPGTDENGNTLGPRAGRSNGAVSVGQASPGSGGRKAAVLSPPGDCTRPELGSISERFESNGNPGATNDSAVGADKGGWSYGSYQIASQVGAMGDFMAFLAVEANGFQDFQSALEKAGGERAAKQGKGFGFYEKWKDLAKSEETSTRFKQCQHDFIQRQYHDRAVAGIKKEHGVDICDGSHSNGMQDAIWSSAVQHGVGGAQTIFRNAYNNVLKRDDVRGDKTKVTDEMLINAIYDDRSRVEVKFKSSPNLWPGLRSRFAQERVDALANNSNTTYNIPFDASTYSTTAV